MKIHSIQQTKFDNIKLPETVYKYRQANNTIHRTILTEREVFFASPNTFPDKFDCKIPWRYDLLSDTEIYNYYLNTLRDIYPNADYLFLQQEATRWSNKGIIRDKQWMDEKELQSQIDFGKVYGVLSLTAEPANIEMWDTYSDEFNGFCVGFNPKIMFKYFGSGGKVDYVDTLPIILPTDTTETKMLTLTYTKLKEWKFEKEYRTSKMWNHPVDDNERKFRVPNSAFTELIIGHRVPQATKEEIIQQARNVNPLIKIMLTYLQGNNVLFQPCS